MNGDFNYGVRVPASLMGKRRAEREAAGLPVDGHWSNRTPKEQKQFLRSVLKEMRLNEVFPHRAPDSDEYLPERGRLDWWIGQLRSGELNSDLLRPDSEIPWLFRGLLTYACIVGDRRCIRLLVQWHTEERVQARLPLTQLLRHLESAAFLAYLRKKVAPAWESIEIPRPIFVKPRPPTAPIAPPSA